MHYSKPGISYQWRLFSLLLGMCLLLVICFIGFQYFREKQYKADILNAELQIFNTQIIDRLEEGRDLGDWLDTISMPIQDLRVTVFSRKDGRVVYDNTLDVLPGGTHLHRRELKQALAEGRSYSLRPGKGGLSKIYFFAVTPDDDWIVRSGSLYNSVSVSDVLAADRTFLWFMFGVSILIGTIGYYASRNIGQTITRLSKFAEAAEKGEAVSDTTRFPRDELGHIAANIVSMYNQLLNTTAERDRQQLMLIKEEEEKQHLKRDLTNNINHELKTPVASILGCAETLVDHPELPEKIHTEFMGRIVSNAKRLASLLRDISTINRLDEGSSVIDRHRFDLTKLVREVVSDAAPRAEKQGMTAECNLPEGLYVNGNQSLLESVFRNLIENAIAYSGGTKVSVNMLEDSPDQFTVSVTDNGSGIPEEHFAKIFDRFYRIDKGRSRKAGGTGLGLAIVHNAVLFHGGDITIANLPEGGLEFAITLPRAETPRPDEEPEPEEEQVFGF